jgi:4-hydroxybenzoyl-CoA thioesterase
VTKNSLAGDLNDSASPPQLTLPLAATGLGRYAKAAGPGEHMSGKSFVQQRRLNWGEADPAGTIYAPRAIDFAIQAIEALWIEATGLSFNDLFAREGLGAPWVHTSCEFANPLRAGEDFHLRIGLERIGRASLNWIGEAARPNGAPLFRLKLVSVIIDAKSGESRPVPDAIRNALSAYVTAS